MVKPLQELVNSIGVGIKNRNGSRFPTHRQQSVPMGIEDLCKLPNFAGTRRFAAVGWCAQPEFSRFKRSAAPGLPFPVNHTVQTACIRLPQFIKDGIRRRGVVADMHAGSSYLQFSDHGIAAFQPAPCAVCCTAVEIYPVRQVAGFRIVVALMDRTADGIQQRCGFVEIPAGNRRIAVDAMQIGVSRMNRIVLLDFAAQPHHLFIQQIGSEHMKIIIHRRRATAAAQPERLFKPLHREFLPGRRNEQAQHRILALPVFLQLLPGRILLQEIVRKLLQCRFMFAGIESRLIPDIPIGQSRRIAVAAYQFFDQCGQRTAHFFALQRRITAGVIFPFRIQFTGQPIRQIKTDRNHNLQAGFFRRPEEAVDKGKIVLSLPFLHKFPPDDDPDQRITVIRHIPAIFLKVGIRVVGVQPIHRSEAKVIFHRTLRFMFPYSVKESA